MKYLKGRKYLDALCVYFWATTPVFISILTFTCYSLMGNRLTAATVFTTVALLNMLISPLNAFPWVMNGLIEAWVSIKRIEKLIKLPDHAVGNFFSKVPANQAMVDILVEDGVFKWGKESIDSDGQFIGVMGPVGCGKTTLLAALLGELEKENGSIAISETDS
ncbi:hypothetical protein J437_LFUL018888, partial [Ladona fulva]